MSYIKTVRENVGAYNLLGFDSAELQDLLGVLIGNSATPELTGKLAAKGIVELSKMTVQEFVNEGLTKLKALELHSAFTLAKKLTKVEKAELYHRIRSPEDAANYIMDEISYLDQEHFVAIFLNTKNEVIGKKVLFIGSLNSSIVHPRELFREAIKVSAASTIVFHNHPSGHLTPSPEDIDVTERLVKAGKITGIDVLDHVIVSHGKFISLKEKGYF